MIDLSQLAKIKTPEDYERDRKATEAKAYLAETDWYGWRLVEEGTPMPEDIKQLRAEARKAIEDQVNAAS